MIPMSWPFATWGIDIWGPFPRAWGGYRFLIVAIDTFTKWVEAKPVGRITKENTAKFWRALYCVLAYRTKCSRIMVHNLPAKKLRIFVKDMPLSIIGPQSTTR